jgi:hypothetical protein
MSLWWVGAVGAYAVGVFLPRPRFAFIIGFLGVAVAWLGRALWLDAGNQGLLSGRVAQLFGLHGSFWAYAFTLIIGGLSGGLGALAGQALGAYLKKKRSQGA